MKKRFGFVSNSSSTSFCLLGIKDEKGNGVEGLDEVEGITDYEGAFIGLHPRNIGGDETINQAKQRIVDAATKAGIECKMEDVNWYVDGGYDG